MRRSALLAGLYAQRLGAAVSDPIVANNIQRTAELQAIADDLRQRRLGGDKTVHPDFVVRSQRVADFALRRLFEGRKQAKAAAGPSLSEYLSRNEAPP